MSTRKTSSWSTQHTIPSDVSVGNELISELLEAMLQRGWTATDQFHVHLAYQEAMTNAVVHGNRRSLDKTVDVEMGCDDQQVWIRITDQGAGFDADAVPDPRREDLREIPGGRGLLLMSEVMSEVRYNASGNQITLTKHRGKTRGSAA